MGNEPARPPTAATGAGPDRIRIRPAIDADSPGLVALVGVCFSEYPNCLLDVDGEETTLLTPASSYDRFWVAECQSAARDPRIAGCIGLAEHTIDGRPGTELKKLYVHPLWRGCGLARRLCNLVLDHALARGHATVELWSDTRFETAHRVYEHLGWRASGRERELHDLSATREFHYVKQL